MPLDVDGACILEWDERKAKFTIFRMRGCLEMRLRRSEIFAEVCSEVTGGVGGGSDWERATGANATDV